MSEVTTTKEESRLRPAEAITQRLNLVIPLLGLILVTAFFQIVTEGMLLAGQNLSAILNQSFSVMLIAVGATFIFAHGGLDMSFGAVMALGGMLGAMAGQATDSLILCLVVAVLVGMGCSFLNGIVAIRLGIPSFISSMCMQYICRGIVSTVTSTTRVTAPANIYGIDKWSIKAAVLILVVAAGVLLFHFTRIGKNNKAIGGNAVAAAQAGVNVARYRVIAYVISGALVGLAGFFTLGRTGSIGAATGQGLEIDVMTAIVLGGMPLSGGARSTMRAAVVGAFITAILSNGLILWGMSGGTILLLKGLVFLITIFASYTKSKGKVLA